VVVKELIRNWRHRAAASRARSFVMAERIGRARRREATRREVMEAEREEWVCGKGRGVDNWWRWWSIRTFWDW
jgi:hypothetical protein